MYKFLIVSLKDFWEELFYMFSDMFEIKHKFFLKSFLNQILLNSSLLKSSTIPWRSFSLAQMVTSLQLSPSSWKVNDFSLACLGKMSRLHSRIVLLCIWYYFEMKFEILLSCLFAIPSPLKNPFVTWCSRRHL